MYYTVKENKIYEVGNSSLYMTPELGIKETDIITYDEYQEHPNKVILQNGVLALNPNYEDEEAEKRENQFKATFFNIEDYGWYRRVPKGYTSAVESINSLKLWYGTTGVPQGVIVFYTAPDFAKSEECTEEWLVEHSFTNEQMTAEELDTFGRAFMTAWNYEEHEREINQGV